MTRTRLVALTLPIALALSACGSDADDSTVGADPVPTAADPTQPTHPTSTDSTDSTPPVSVHGHDAPATVTVDGVDYGFENLPASVPAGTRLALHNASANELHELVAFRLDDDNTTPLDELVTLPEAELNAVLGAPVAVMLQAPGSDELIPAVGDGVLSESGRYAVLCFIPSGADPAEYLRKAAESGGGPPQGVAGGAPHFVHGMYAELEVTDD